ncbi:MAG: vanadium-dependent haloperoxidase [Chitinophagaceae bacterium]|nr:vanadium-dependent haloperoxidase [Chitinophagaceae bacterium]
MKKILLFLLPVVMFSCKKNTPKHDQPLENYSSDLVKDWIDLQLKVIKNATGITHVAYSRHFAYTGVALYEALEKGDNRFNSIAAQLNGSINLPSLPPGKKLFYPAAANSAIAAMLRFFYSANASSVQSIDSLEQVYINRHKAEIAGYADITEALTYGRQIATSVIEWSKHDGSTEANIPYTPLGEGYWEPTAPGFVAANVPGWGNNRTILKGSILGTMPPAPIAFSKVPGSAFYNMAKELFDISLALTPEQKALANFWDDAPNGKYLTAFGHWFSVLSQVIDMENCNILKAADAYLRLGISLHESIISCWQAKYTYHQIRPITYIQKHMGHPEWKSLITTPPHPEYSAAHATLSASAGYALESVFGKNYSFTDHSYDGIGMSPRTYSSFEAAGYDAGLSRLYGGIHYKPSIEAGNTQGKKVGKSVEKILKSL